MPKPDYRSLPDQHLDPDVAAIYDTGHNDEFANEVITPTIETAQRAGSRRTNCRVRRWHRTSCATARGAYGSFTTGLRHRLLRAHAG